MKDLKSKLKIYIDNNLIDEKPRKNGYFSKIKCLYKFLICFLNRSYCSPF